MNSAWEHTSYLSFFTQAKFLENKIYTEKRVNYDKLHSKLPILRVNYDKLHSKFPILRVNYDKLHSKLPIFRVKFYTRQKKFTRAPPVAPVTNMRYGCMMSQIILQPEACECAGALQRLCQHSRRACKAFRRIYAGSSPTRTNMYLLQSVPAIVL